MKPLSIVYALGRGSIWQDNELRFSLRSVEKYLEGYGEVFIIGKQPSFGIKNVTHIQINDVSDYYPALNIMKKIYSYCAGDKGTEDFLFMNDDHWLLRKFNISEFPYFYKGELKDQLTNPTDYAKTIANTIDVLRGYPLKDFDTHTPILYNKEVFMQIMDKFDWTIPHGYCIKSLYCNLKCMEGTFEQDGKIRKAKNEQQLRAWLDTHSVFSVADEALNNFLKKRFEKLYPNPSKHEST